MKIISSAIVILTACIASTTVQAGRGGGSGDGCRRLCGNGGSGDSGGGGGCRRLATCTEQEYKLSVSVSGAHVALTAEPNCEASPLRGIDNSCEQCPLIALHTVTFEQEGQEYLEKSLDTFDKEDFHREFESLHLGNFEIGSVLEAFDDTPVKNNKYSLFGNNCASFLISLGRKIGLNPTDRNIVKFVSSNLSKQAKPMIIEELSIHKEGVSMIESNPDEHAVIEEFVSTYIHERANIALDAPDPSERKLRDAC